MKAYKKQLAGLDGLDTEEIMQLALSMAKMNKVPADSGVCFPGRNIRKVLFSIDVSTSELLLARTLRCDAVVAHHPIGKAIVTFPDVVKRHVTFMKEAGVPVAVAEKAAGELREKLEVRRHPSNYQHIVSVARRLRMPLMNVHLPIDEITRQYLLRRIRETRAKSVGDLVDSFERIPEFRKAATRVEVMMGERSSEVGKTVLVFAAGTNGGYQVAKAYFDHGVDTVVYLHIDYDELVRLRRDSRGNLIVLGHIAGDSIGVNIFLRSLRKEGVEVLTVGVID